MRIIAISDPHTKLPTQLPKGDVLVIAGDLTFNGRRDFARQAAWINTKFKKWLEKQESHFKKIIGIAGNHDSVFEVEPGLIGPLSWTYLEDSMCVVDGVKFWGTPWSRRFYDWGFNRDANFRDRVFSLIPEDIDVLISHTPPTNCGLLDHCYDGHVGDEVLLDHIYRVKPKIVICGHIHAGGGMMYEFPDIDTKVYNVSLLNESYEYANPIGIIDL